MSFYAFKNVSLNFYFRSYINHYHIKYDRLQKYLLIKRRDNFNKFRVICFEIKMTLCRPKNKILNCRTKIYFTQLFNSPSYYPFLDDTYMILITSQRNASAFEKKFVKQNSINRSFAKKFSIFPELREALERPVHVFSYSVITIPREYFREAHSRTRREYSFPRPYFLLGCISNF